MKKKSVVIVGSIVVVGALVGAITAKKKNRKFTDVADGVSKALNPINAEPATPLETAAYLESLTPSLMTRSSVQQGIVTGTSVLGAKVVSSVTESATNVLIRGDDSYANKLFSRSALAFGGYSLSKLHEKNNESLIVSSVRSAGKLLQAASIGGIVYDSITTLAGKKAKNRNVLIPIVLGMLLTTGVLYKGKNMLEKRRSLIDTIPQDPSNKIVPATLSSLAVIQTLKLLGFGMKSTRLGLEKWLGEGPLKKNVARLINLGLWSSVFIGVYWSAIAKIGTKNEEYEPAYVNAPKNPNVSGSPKSFVTFKQLGMQGRKFVSNVVNEDNIQKATGMKAKAKPIRIYVGFNTPERYHTERAELAIKELKRTKAFERKYLLLVSPTGTGWIDHTSVESAEIFSGGDIATCVVQFAKYPSFLALQKIHEGRRQFRELLWSVKLMLDELPKEKRPKVLVFGLSLGSWASSDVVMHTGIAGFDYYGIDRALWAGMPGLAKWGKVRSKELKVDIPKGTVGVFDRREQFEKLSKKEKDYLRAIILNHDDDPITLVRPKLIVKKPSWLADNNRGRGVPMEMKWSPLFTFLQVAIDAANAMLIVPGKFRSHGHDYRGDMAYFVNQAYQFGATPAVVKKTNDLLVQLELERAKKSKELAANIE